MVIKRGLIIGLGGLLGLLGGVGAAWGQGLGDVRINELLVVNQSSYVDDHGGHSSWLELHNTGYSSVNVGGAYLTVKYGDQRCTYRIPKNDARTLIAPQGYLIFFANGSSDRGTFHTNFLLDQTGYVALLDQGRNVVDSVRYDVTEQEADISIGWLKDVETQDLQFGILPGITPMQANEVEEGMLPSEKFRQRDPSGYVMALTAMSVVFLALIALYGIFRTIGKANVRAAIRKERAAVVQMPAEVKPLAKPELEMNGEVIAAISLALRRYDEDLHDIESHVLTINRVARVYSPWSSRIYGVSNFPNRN